MKKLVGILSLFLFLFCFACKKNNMPDLIDNASYLDSINMVKIKTDSINELIMQALIGQLGNYDVTCRFRTTDFIVDTTCVYPLKEIDIDSLFSDTLALVLKDSVSFSDILNAQMTDPKVDESTIFVSSEFFHNDYGYNFFITFLENKTRYNFALYSYGCKCTGFTRLENDSIYYRYYNAQSSFEVIVDCNGAKIN